VEDVDAAVQHAPSQRDVVLLALQLEDLLAELAVGECGAIGLGCVVRSGRVSCTRRGPPSCSPDPASCLGDELRFCADGIPFRVSCKEIGMSTCDPAGGGGEALCK